MKWRRFGIIVATGWSLITGSVHANIPGGGTGTGPNVTLTDNGSTVTLGNGIISIVCTKSGGTINHIYYTFNNGSGTQTLDLLSGGHNGGLLYWENSNNQGLSFTYSLVTDPASNGGNYAEISLVTTSEPNDVLEVHYSLLRGSTGFYVTAMYKHRSVDGTFGLGECRDNIYAGSIFNWMSVDGAHNRLMQVSGGSAIGVQGAPKEVSLWTNGIYAGQYEDKYKYSADFGVNHCWGWSSVGSGGKNVGLWNITASSEYYNGGPLKLELMEHLGTTILNMLNGGHYGMGSDGSFASGEVWTKVCGPYFIYCNHVSNTLTGTNAPAQALYNDALAQTAAEASAWPYSWFNNADYAPASDRGTVTGKFVIADSGNPNASAAALWVGLVQQPATINGTYDFQQWAKPYQFWTKTDANGNFTISNVIAGANYTLYAFGPGAPGMFTSQNQTGGNPPVLYDLPATQFAVNATGGATNDLGTVTWTPARVGATVFQIGYPNRTSDKFRHGDDWWVGDIGPNPDSPSPIWSKWLEYPFDFPDGVNYVVGQSRWSTDWNYVQPVIKDHQGNYNNSSSTITFNLATGPTSGATASLYLGLSSDYYAAIIVTVNGINLGSVGGVTGSPNNSIPTTGYYPGYSRSDTTIREGNQAAASDERISFPAALLHAGANTITIGIRQIGGSYFADHAMYDYIRLELAGYVPPAPASVNAYAGNHGALITWPVTPGATSYNILRSTISLGGFVSITNGVAGPVCGSGLVNASYLDTNVVDGTTYYYEVQSENPVGQSLASSASPGVTPSAGESTSPPAAPNGLNVSSVSHATVNLAWAASPGAAFYTVYRSTVVDNGAGDYVVLSTITLDNSITGTTYTDDTPTDGSTYQYFVTATSAGGTSDNSAVLTATPLPTAPATAPSVSITALQTTNAVLSWPPVSGAVGYIIKRANNAGGPYTLLASITETNYTDGGLSLGGNYYYSVTAMNAGGTSPSTSGIPFGPGAASLVWSGNNGSAWDASTVNWLNGSTATTYADGDDVQFDDSGATGSVVIGGTVSPGSVIFDNSNLDYTVSTTGGGIAGNASLVKAGNGNLILDSTNGYTGGTLLNAGTLLADNASGSATGSGAVTINSGATLGGTGSIAGPVTVNDGGRVTPGDSFGTLTLSGSLTLATGSGIHFAIQHSPLTNSAIQVQGTFNENGALVVTNTGTTALAAGDHFQLITASARAGAFADVALPPLNSGLAWDTSTLNTTGDLTVVVSTPPVISSSFVAGNQFVLQASNGTPGRPVYVLTSTNLAAPLASWIPIATNEFDGAGNFAFTNTLDLQAEQNFYRLQTP